MQTVAGPGLVLCAFVRTAPLAAAPTPVPALAVDG